MKSVEEKFMTAWNWTIEVEPRDNDDKDCVCKYQATHIPADRDHVEHSPAVMRWIDGRRILSIRPIAKVEPVQTSPANTPTVLDSRKSAVDADDRKGAGHAREDCNLHDLIVLTLWREQVDKVKHMCLDYELGTNLYSRKKFIETLKATAYKLEQSIKTPDA